MTETEVNGYKIRPYADLIRANLYGANLFGANLFGALLGKDTVIDAQPRYDGYLFILLESGRIKAGCRDFTIPEYEEHVLTYKDSYKRDCTLAILKKFRRQIEDLNPSVLGATSLHLTNSQNLV